MGTDRPGFGSLEDFRAWCELAPEGTRLEALVVGDVLAQLPAEPQPAPTQPTDSGGDPWTWRERLWIVPTETRLGVVEVAEALGRPKSYVYAHTGERAENPIPHRKLDSALVFTAGELRAWIRAHETVVHAGPMESTPAERGGLRAL